VAAKSEDRFFRRVDRIESSFVTAPDEVVEDGVSRLVFAAGGPDHRDRSRGKKGLKVFWDHQVFSILSQGSLE
jgi:hypothetical protein